MIKDEVIGLVLIGTFFGGIGAMIGGFVTHKINKNHISRNANVWKSTTILFKELLLNSLEKNDELKRKIKSMEEA